MKKNLSNYVLPLGLPLCFTPKDGGEFLSQDNKSGRNIRNDRIFDYIKFPEWPIIL